jgi:hypothetical protein
MLDLWNFFLPHGIVILLVVSACTMTSNTPATATAPAPRTPVENREPVTNAGDDGAAGSTPQTADLAPAPTQTEAAVENTSDEKGVIFPAEVVRESWWFALGYFEAGENWTPDPAQVAALETALIPFLKTAKDPWLRPDPPIWERVPNYQRQYIGLIEDGRQIIYGNYFCNSAETDWRKELVQVNDGGDCYFQVKYDVETGTIYDLRVNGEA